MTRHFLKETEDGVQLLIRIQTRSSRSGPLGELDGNLKWGVNSPPVDGAANAELLRSLAEFFSIPRTHASIVQGERSKNKRVHLLRAEISNVEARLREKGL